MKFLVISIFLLLIVQIINDQVCENTKKGLTRNDCFANSTSEIYCCYNGSDSSCEQVNKNSLSNATLDCGISEENYGKYEFGQYYPEQDLGDVDLGLQSCGKNKPKNRGDCTDYSQLTNSCCRFSVDGKSGCFFIGKKYLGKIEKKKYYFNSSHEIEYECNSFNLMPKLFLLFSLLLFL